MKSSKFIEFKKIFLQMTLTYLNCFDLSKPEKKIVCNKKTSDEEMSNLRLLADTALKDGNTIPTKSTSQAKSSKK